MGVDELTGLNLSQQFFGVSAHVTGRYLVAQSLEILWVGSASMG